MSFGFSIGDFLAVGGVIADIVSSLKDSTGSESDYQELIRELNALDRALKGLDKLQPTTSSPGTVDSIKCAALSCRVPLEEFLSKIKKYEVTLGPRAPTPSIALSSKAVLRKITWLNKAEDVDHLRKYLDIHLGTINILLLEHGLETLDVSSKALQEQCVDIRASLRGIDNVINSTATNVQSQTALVRSTHGILTSLYSMISGEVRSSLSQIARFTQSASLLSQRIFEAVVQLQASVSAISVDTRWTYFQAPVKVEDALGRVFPVPSEYSMCELEALLRCRFRKGPGRKQVRYGDFKLTDRRNKAVINRATMPELIPGLDIIMSIVISVIAGDNLEACPVIECSSKNTVPAIWGSGRTCLHCGRWFDTSEETSQSTTTKQRIEEVNSDESSDSGQESASRRYSKRLRRRRNAPERDPAFDPDIGCIRNLSCVQFHPLVGKREAAFQEAGGPLISPLNTDYMEQLPDLPPLRQYCLTPLFGITASAEERRTLFRIIASATAKSRCPSPALDSTDEWLILKTKGLTRGGQQGHYVWEQYIESSTRSTARLFGRTWQRR
ncbi:hypothetical protein V8F33_011824 [Rhypophila sp. PSN 637]